MRRTEMLQEIRKMRFEEVYFGWSESRLTQEEAARGIGAPGEDWRETEGWIWALERKAFFLSDSIPFFTVFSH